MAAFKPYGVMTWPQAVDFGLVDDFSVFVIHAEAITVNTEWRTFWPDDSIFVPPPEGGLQMTVSSTSANDTAGGSGSQMVQLTSLVPGLAPGPVENIATDGQNGVLTTATDIFRNMNLRSTHAGASRWNEGTIYLGTGTITAGVPATVYAVMPPTIGQTRGYIFTVPKNEVYTFNANVFTSDGNKDAELTFRVKQTGIGETSFFSTGSFDVSTYIQIGPFLTSYGPFGEGVEVEVQCRSKGGTVDLKLSTLFKTMTIMEE